MRIYLVRHGWAGSGSDDEVPDRELTLEGEDTVRAVADWMLRKNEIPAFIYASPMVRTQQTAEILRDAFGLDKYVIDPSIGPNMSFKGLLERLVADDLVMRPLIVSHGETIGAGLKAISGDAMSGFDHPAMGELRIVRVKRGDVSDWGEHRRVMPSDLGFGDHYSSNPIKS
jgi:phosphohistidine phosphatase